MVSETQVNAAGRHIISFAGGGLTLLAAFGMVTPDQAKDIISASQDVMAGLSQATGGLAKIFYIVGPLMGVSGALYAAKSANLFNQIKSVIDAARKPTEKGDEAKLQLVDAVSTLPKVDKIISPELSDALPNNDKVVAS